MKKILLSFVMACVLFACDKKEDNIGPACNKTQEKIVSELEIWAENLAQDSFRVISSNQIYCSESEQIINGLRFKLDYGTDGWSWRSEILTKDDGSKVYYTLFYRIAKDAMLYRSTLKSPDRQWTAEQVYAAKPDDKYIIVQWGV